MFQYFFGEEGGVLGKGLIREGKPADFFHAICS